MKNTNNKGITLIALIITVILLIILSAVSIGVIINGDLFGRAKDTVGKANSQIEDSKDKEEQAISVWDALPGKVVKSRTTGETTIELSVVTSNVTTKSFRVHVTGTNANGDILTYVLKVGKTTYEEKQGEEVYWDVTGLNPGTTYQFEVIAKDSSTQNRVICSETTLANNKPDVTINALNSKTTNSLKINARATDRDGDNLTYKLYTSTSQNGTYTLQQTSSAIAENTQVTLTASNLSQYTTYYWYIEVSDGKTNTKSSTKSTRTLCSGTGLTCSTSLCEGYRFVTCTNCGGDKKYNKICSDQSRCTECGGSGSVPGCTGSPIRESTSGLCGVCGRSRVQTYSCSKCGYIVGCTFCMEENHFGEKTCSNCSGEGYLPCNHGYTSAHTIVLTCNNCDANGNIKANCIHGYSSSHRYCPHYNTTTLTSHSYCSHGYVSEHE